MNETKQTSPIVAPAVVEKLPPGAVKLPTCSCRVKIAKNGSDVTLSNITPPEMYVLTAIHHREAGGNPILDIEATSSVVVLPEQELARLRGKYSSKHLSRLFSSASQTLIDSFERAQQLGLSVTLIRTNLVDSGLSGNS